MFSNNSFDPEADVPDLSGKIFVVTGGSAGIGFGITAHLLQHNAQKIIILSQNEDHATEAIHNLKEFGDASKLSWIQCDFKDLKAVEAVALRLKQEETRIDALICNAGEGVGKFKETKDRLDSHIQVNHLSQFLLFRTLIPNLQQTPDSRLILQSSELHRAPLSSVKFASEDELTTDLGPNTLYARSKLAQILTIRALARRFADNEPGFQSPKFSGPWCNATHPGAVATDQPNQAIEAYGTLGLIGVKMTRPFMKDPISQGCRTALWAATSEDIVSEKVQGQYIVPDRKITDPSKQAQDVELGESLWALSERILKDRLGRLPWDS